MVNNGVTLLNDAPHAFHAYTHKRMDGEMAVRLQGRYNFIFNGQVCVYMSEQRAKALANELTSALESRISLTDKAPVL